MKQLFVLFALIGMFAFNANGQSCHGAKKASATKSSCSAKSACTAAAAKAASMDSSIEKKVCAKSGTVSYVRNVKATDSDKMVSNAVEYCSKSGKFVNVSPKGKENCAKSCTKGAKSTKASKACCAKGAKASKASCSAKDAKASKASCSASKKASCTAAQKASCNAKKVKTEVKTEVKAQTEAANSRVKLVKSKAENN